MANSQHITAEYVRTILDYDPLTGIFVWRQRPGDKAWNARFAGRVAGGVNNHGYHKIGIGPCRLHSARLAWLYIHGHWPDDQIDHKNGIRDDNRLENLRQATPSQNMANRRVSKVSKLGVKGVSKVERRFVAIVHKDGRVVFNKSYKTLDEASAAYQQAAAAHHGEYVRKSA